jgi:arginase family enzyme
MGITEADVVIPDFLIAKDLERTCYEIIGGMEARPVWNNLIRYALEKKYGNFSLDRLPFKHVFENSKKVSFLGEAKSICYDFEKLSADEFGQIQVYGSDKPDQPLAIADLAKKTAEKVGLTEGDVIIGPDHGFAVALQTQIGKPDTIVDFDWHYDANEKNEYDRSSWLYHLRNNPKIFGIEKPRIIHSRTALTKRDMDDVVGKVAVTVCLDVLRPEYADAVINIRSDGGMGLEELIKQLEMMKSEKDIVSLSLCERRMSLDNTANTANTIRKVIENYFKS